MRKIQDPLRDQSILRWWGSRAQSIRSSISTPLGNCEHDYVVSPNTLALALGTCFHPPPPPPHLKVFSEFGDGLQHTLSFVYPSSVQRLGFYGTRDAQRTSTLDSQLRALFFF